MNSKPMLISAPAARPSRRWLVPRALAAVHQAVARLDWAQTPALLLARLYVAQVFLAVRRKDSRLGDHAGAI